MPSLEAYRKCLEYSSMKPCRCLDIPRVPLSNDRNAIEKRFKKPVRLKRLDVVDVMAKKNEFLE